MFSPWKGPVWAESTRQICFRIFINKGWKRTLGSWRSTECYCFINSILYDTFSIYTMLIQSFWLPSSTDSEHLHIKGLICEQELDQCHRYDIRGGNLQENVPLSRFPGLLFSSQPTVTLYVKGGGAEKCFFWESQRFFWSIGSSYIYSLTYQWPKPCHIRPVWGHHTQTRAKPAAPPMNKLLNLSLESDEAKQLHILHSAHSG